MAEEKQIAFEDVDFTQPTEIYKLFPIYIREKIRLADMGAKKVGNTVDISPYTLETPYKDKILLKNTHLHLEPFKRHCLFGSNGTGKTLLFERMADMSIPGFPLHLNVHHCKEMEHMEKPENVLDTVVHSHPFLMTVRKCDAKIKELVAAAGDDKEKLAALTDSRLMIEQYMRQLESETAEEEAIKMLRALGFDETGMSRSTNDLSGGLRMRVALAVAFFSKADLLLLDEPTNHLDFPSVLWLENRLRGYSKSFLLVTHDRDLLCNVTTSTLLLEDQQIKYYPCGFGEFEKRKAKEDAKRDKETDRFLDNNRNADPSTMAGKRVHDMRLWQQKYHERLVLMQGKFTFPKPTPLPKDCGEEVNEDGSTTLLDLKDVTFTYSVEKKLPYIFEDPINFKVTTKSRVGIMGPNGAGKSTLLKLLTKKHVPTTGTQSEHPNFVLAYFGQHSTAELVMEQTPMEFMTETFPESKSGLIREHLKKTGVSGGVESTRMINLSYSQRSCVIFAKLTYVCPHLLIMDEPTNFLDIESVDSLIKAANSFPGALLVVTHSRHFLRACAKTFLSVVPGQFLPFRSMEKAEAATYTFMQELEAGGKIGKMDAGQMGAGGGTVHVKKATTEGGVETKFQIGEQVTALWTDKKYYTGEVKAVITTDPKKTKYTIFYPEFNKKANIPEAGVKKIDLEAIANAEKKAAEDAAAKKLATAKALKAAKNHKWAAGDQCMAPSKDGRFYAGKVVEVLPFGQLIIKYDSRTENTKIDTQKVRLYDAATVSSGSVDQKAAGRAGKGGAKGAKGGKGGKGKNKAGKGGKARGVGA